MTADGWLRDADDLDDINKTGCFGSERDGGFAGHATMPAGNAPTIQSGLADAESAPFRCSCSAAEGMLDRAQVNSSDTVLVPGASGGAGGALAQLAKRHGACVIAMASEAKHANIALLGLDKVLSRAPDDLRAALGAEKPPSWRMSRAALLADAHQCAPARRAARLLQRDCGSHGPT